jgi:hypothetical protein
MNNSNKKYEMGGAVQSFSSPMLAQGMQGGLSGFGTSGLGMFEKGGLLGKDDLDFLDSINDQDKMRDGGELKRSDLQVGDVVTHKKGKGNAHGRIYKITETAFYLEDKFGNKSERAQYFANDFKKVKRLEDGGQISDIERILAKYRDIQSNQPKKDPTQEFLNKSWEGKNLDDYIMYSDRYKRGGEVPSIGDSGTITDKNSMFLGKMATITADLGNMYEVRVGERTTIVKKNGINIVSDQYADGGEVNKYEATFDQLKKGDVVTLKFGSSISRENDVKLIVKSKNLVGKGKTYESEKITFAQVNNPNGVKFYGYKRKSGYIGFASGDMGINVTNISIENKFEDGGVTFIEYKDNEIMYEPSFNKYYANDVEFDTLEQAQKFLDSGEMSDSIRGAYARGLYEKGGELKKPIWIAIYEKGSKRKVFELNANSREEAKIEAEKGKKQYKIPEEMFLYDVFRKFADGGDVADPISYAKTLGQDSQDWEAQLKEYAGDQYDSLTQEERREIIADMQTSYDRNTHFAKGGEIDPNVLTIDKIVGTKIPISVGSQSFNPNNAWTKDEVIDKVGRILKHSLLDYEFYYNYLSSEYKKEYLQIWNEEIYTKMMKNINNVLAKYLKIATGSMSHWGLQWNLDARSTDQLIDNFFRYSKKLPQKVKDEYAFYRNDYAGVDINKPMLKQANEWVNTAIEKYKTFGKQYLNKSIYDVPNDYYNQKQGWIERIEVDKKYKKKQILSKGGEVSSQKIYEVEYEIGGKKHTSQFLMYDSDRVENLLPPATKIISIKEKFAKGGTLEVRGDSLDEIKKQAKLISKNWKKNTYVLETTSRNFTTNNKTRKYTWGDDEDVNHIKSITHDMRENITILMRYNNGNLMSAEEEIIYKSPSLQNFHESKYAKGGKIGFEGLAKKVAKRYKGKAVSKEYQAEYGKTYDAKEAKEVGNKVAAKVYRQQVAKKKIVRKLQRKTN